MTAPPSDDTRRCSAFTEEGGYARPRLRILGAADNDRQEEARNAIQRRVEDSSGTVNTDQDNDRYMQITAICRLPGNKIEHIVYSECVRGSVGGGGGGAGCCVRCSGMDCFLCHIFLAQDLTFATKLFPGVHLAWRG